MTNYSELNDQELIEVAQCDGMSDIIISSKEGLVNRDEVIQQLLAMEASLTNKN